MWELLTSRVRFTTGFVSSWHTVVCTVVQDLPINCVRCRQEWPGSQGVERCGGQEFGGALSAIGANGMRWLAVDLGGTKINSGDREHSGSQNRLLTAPSPGLFGTGWHSCAYVRSRPSQLCFAVNDRRMCIPYAAGAGLVPHPRLQRGLPAAPTFTGSRLAGAKVGEHGEALFCEHPYGKANEVTMN
jgi:hypothetical protein